MNDAVRKFEDAPAVQGATPLLFGLIGASGSGKTYSALRLATGMQRIVGGDIYVIDTEHSRASHYAQYFKFRHVPFAAPFSPLDYIDALNHCFNKGAKIIIIDSLSHEHSGQGGCLEWHQAEVERLMKAWNVSEDKANIPAWAKPKAARRQLINCITQSDAHVFACFRAKDKIKIGGGKVVQLGWMPDAGEEFVFELAAKSLLMPGAGGVPTWNSDQPGEKMMIKLPEYFRTIFSGKDGKPLDEDIGQKLAEWAAGAPTAKLPVADLEKHFAAIKASETMDALQTTFKAAVGAANATRDADARERFVIAKDARKEALIKKDEVV
ncbi:MAG: AAA family ATPase [Candidatus Acidiferrales bacterium]|jgi:ABC-type oligopeptide transport system ATPase subunit